jgi:FAD:protein FMN transferase
MKSTGLAILVAVAVLGAALLLLSNGGGNQPHLVSVEREVMGAHVVIAVYDTSTQAAEEAIDSAFTSIAEIESVASPLDDASEISELNRTSYLPAASDKLVAMLRLASVVHQVSGGAFDVTMGALHELWQFDPQAETQFRDLSRGVQSPSITVARKHVGMERILLGSGRKTSISLVPGTILDLGPIAMGTAVDAAIDTLHDAGIQYALVTADGKWRAFGGTPKGLPWEIVLGDPNNDVVRFLLNDGAIAVAGNCERLFDSSTGIGEDLDPRSGFPIAEAAFVAVVAPTCAEAGALATSVLVLGTESGLALIERLVATETLFLECEDPEDARGSSGFGLFQTPLDD